MSTSVIRPTNGPDKSDLLRALGQQLHATFDTADGPIEAQVEVMEEQGSGGVGFMMWGHLVSSNLRGAYFTGAYNCKNRTVASP